MLGTYAKAIAGSTVVPVARKLPGVPGPSRELPDRVGTRDEVEVDREHLAAYDRVCGFRLRDQLPPTYPHVVAFPLAMELMTDTSFPFPVLGIVHIGNRIDVVSEMTADRPFSVRVWAADMAEHDKGTQFQIHAEASVDGAVTWRSASTYLHREKKGGDGDKPKRESASNGAHHHDPSAVWSVPDDIGRRYAAVSGDRNPIHMHPLSAKLFGMKTAIAHGAWTKAHALAALEGELPNDYTVDVRFKLPLFLPSKVAFSTWVEGSDRRFDVRALKDGKPHLDGSVTAN
jgi:acyl dehydratase